MTVLHRPAMPNDAAALADILNEIIRSGGTTAHQSEFTPDRLARHYIEREGIISCTVAELNGEVAGFQALMWPDEEGQPFPDGWAIIATFVDEKAAGNGVGRTLFKGTQVAAASEGVKTIDATIRADNAGGLAYYNSLGFADYDVLRAIPLRDGRKIDRIRKRLDI